MLTALLLTNPADPTTANRLMVRGGQPTISGRC
jgi:hypothetical protein